MIVTTKASKCAWYAAAPVPPAVETLSRSSFPCSDNQRRCPVVVKLYRGDALAQVFVEDERTLEDVPVGPDIVEPAREADVKGEVFTVDRPTRELPESEGTWQRHRGRGAVEQHRRNARAHEQSANGGINGLEVTDIAQQAGHPDERQCRVCAASIHCLIKLLRISSVGSSALWLGRVE
jgi:hypothetical protein